MPPQAVEELERLERQIEHFVHPDDEPFKIEHDNLQHEHLASSIAGSPNGTKLIPVPRTIKSQIGNPVSRGNVYPVTLR